MHVNDLFEMGVCVSPLCVSLIYELPGEGHPGSLPANVLQLLPHSLRARPHGFRLW